MCFWLTGRCVNGCFIWTAIWGATSAFCLPYTMWHSYTSILEAGKMAEQLRMLAAFSEVGSSSPCRTHMQVSVSRTIQHSSSHGIRMKDFKKKKQAFSGHRVVWTLTVEPPSRRKIPCSCWEATRADTAVGKFPVIGEKLPGLWRWKIITEMSYLGGEGAQWVRAFATKFATLQFESPVPSTCWKGRIYSWKLSSGHHVSSVMCHMDTHTSTEINKDNKDASSEKSTNGGMPCNPNTQGLGDGLWLPWATNRGGGKGGKENGRRKREKRKRVRENAFIFFFSQCMSLTFYCSPGGMTTCASPVVVVGAPVGALAWSAPANPTALLCFWVPPAASRLAHQLLLCLSPGFSTHSRHLCRR